MIEFNNVYRTFSKKEILKDLSLKIDQPLIYGLLGLNGAGKTTTIRLMCGILKPNKGSVKNSFTQNRSTSVGYMPEEVGLYSDMTVLDELLYFGKLHKMTRTEILEYVNPLVDKLGLRAEIHKPISKLSKGTCRKVQFICTIIHNPELIILDEPFSGLDPLSSIVLEEILVNLKNQGKTIILSTHRMEHAELFCDHIFILNHGRKIIDDSLVSLKKSSTKQSYIVHVKSEVSFPNDGNLLYSSEYLHGCFRYKIRFLQDDRMPTLLTDLVRTNTLLHYQEDTPTLKEIFLTTTSSTTA